MKTPSKKIGFQKKASLVFGTALAVLMMVVSTQAVTFTGVRFHGPTFWPEDTLTLNISNDSDVAVLTMPIDIFLNRGDLGVYFSWPPPVAVALIDREIRNARCAVGIGYCEGQLPVQWDTDKGTATIEVSRDLIINAVQHVYLIQKRYDTCLSTGGRVDIATPKDTLCPPVKSSGGIEGIYYNSSSGVTAPWVALGLEIHAGTSATLGHYLFLIDTPGKRAYDISHIEREDLRPLDHQYGELNRMYAEFGEDVKEVVVEEFPTLIFPQYVNGVYGSFVNRTRLILRNLAEESNPVTVEYLDSSGREVDSQTYKVPGSGTVDIQSSGTGDLSVGPLTVTSQSLTSELHGTIIYDFLGYLVSVPSSQLTTEAEIFVSKSADENTALALYNPSSMASLTLSFELHDANGESSGDSNITLEPGQHLALFVDDVSLFGDYLEQQQQFIGHVVISSEGGRFAMVSLLQDAVTGALAAVSPVVH